MQNVPNTNKEKKERVNALNKANQMGVTMADIKQDPARIMVQLMRMQKSMYSKEINTWRMARQEAEDVNNPRRILITELYEDIILDPFIYGQVYNQRILRISNKKFKIVDDKGETNEEVTQLLRRAWFKKFIKHSMESIMYGYSLMYVKSIENALIKDIDLVYREHVSPEKGVFYLNPYDSTGLDFNKPPYVNYCIGVGETNDLGLLNKAAPLYILKKHSWANWDEFEEIFGIPIRWAKTASQDKKVQAEIENWLKDMGSAAYGLFPSDTEFEIRESTRPDAFQVFNEKRKAANEELSILFNGQTMTTTNGSSRSQAEVHERSHQEISLDDEEFVLHVVNDSLFPLLRKLGYPIADGYRFEWDKSIELSPKEKIEIYKGVSDLGFKLDQQEVENAFGVKIVGEKEIAPPKELGGSKPEGGKPAKK